MKKTIISILFALAMAFSAQGLALAANPCEQLPAEAKNSVVCSNSSKDAKTTAKDIINAILWAVGIAAIIVIIWSGITFIIASGNPGKLQTAKTTLIYAIVGLVVSLMAYTIVNFVVERF